MAFRCDRCNLMFGDDEKNEVIVHKYDVPFATQHCNACRAQISTFANSDCIGIVEPGRSGCEAVNEMRARKEQLVPLSRVLEIVGAAIEGWETAITRAEKYGVGDGWVEKDRLYKAAAESILRLLREEFEPG